MAEKVVLDVLPEFILVSALLAAGIASRNLKYESATAIRREDRRHAPVEGARVYRK